MEESEKTLVHIRFLTNDASFTLPDGVYSIADDSTTDDLNKLLKTILEMDEENKTTFIFLIQGRIIPSERSLSSVIEKYQLNAEFEIPIEFMLPTFVPPEKKKSVMHDDAVLAVTSYRGEYIISGCLDGTAHIYNKEGEKLISKQVHEYPITTITTLPSEIPQAFIVIFGSKDMTLSVWEVRHYDQKEGEGFRLEWRKRFMCSGHTDSVQTCAISPSNDILLSGSWDSSIIGWDLQDGLSKYKGNNSAGGARAAVERARKELSKIKAQKKEDASSKGKKKGNAKDEGKNDDDESNEEEDEEDDDIENMKASKAKKSEKGKNKEEKGKKLKKVTQKSKDEDEEENEEEDDDESDAVDAPIVYSSVPHQKPFTRYRSHRSCVTSLLVEPKGRCSSSRRFFFWSAGMDHRILRWDSDQTSSPIIEINSPCSVLSLSGYFSNEVDTLFATPNPSEASSSSSSSDASSSSSSSSYSSDPSILPRTSHLITSHVDGMVRLWIPTVATAIKARPYKHAAMGFVSSVQWVPSSPFHFCSFGHDGRFCLWDARSRIPLHRKRIPVEGAATLEEVTEEKMEEEKEEKEDKSKSKKTRKERGDVKGAAESEYRSANSVQVPLPTVARTLDDDEFVDEEKVKTNKVHCGALVYVDERKANKKRKQKAKEMEEEGEEGKREGQQSEIMVCCGCDDGQMRMYSLKGGNSLQ
eukprot:MONOS_5794.1-p1 / transcript=MONOS_5794.1 / gene=MONOS_5794 / organism=Monocercomonoides_exilis_PA203 / gene_product=unspecified product / transcript_product=unspecified product / location=Mono_scaffold00173:79789-82640(+) / protein_length=696 / sequence_SO=supercontig / SO=protein_coding / is_pseudo=false